MSLHRRAPQRDANEPEIVSAFIKYGCSIERLSVKDAPDLLIGIRGVTFLVEVKNPLNYGKKRELRDGQAAWHRKWRGSPVWVVECPEDVPTCIARATKKHTESPDELRQLTHEAWKAARDSGEIAAAVPKDSEVTPDHRKRKTCTKSD